MAKRRKLLDYLLLGIAGSLLLVLLVLLWVERQLQEPPNYSRIEPGLYQGGWVEQPPPGTTAVLNLCEIPDSYHVEVNRWERIRDGSPAPDIAWLRRMVEFVERNRDEGRVTYVHCRQGVSRSGMVVVAYLMHKHRWTRDHALEYVRTQRPLTRPNHAFMERLLEWERIVLEKPEQP